jgi:hypothetical protein
MRSLVHLVHRELADFAQFCVRKKYLFYISRALPVPESRFMRNPGELFFGNSEQHRRSSLGHIFRYRSIHECSPHAGNDGITIMESSSTARIMAL